MLRFLQVSQHTANTTCCLWRACRCLCVCQCVFICPGLKYAALIKPTAKQKTCQAANSNDPEYAYGCFGENKWAENGIHKHSWYRERRGGERLKSVKYSSQTNSSESCGNVYRFQPRFWSACTICIAERSGVTLPAEHLRVVVDGNVRLDPVIVGPKVAVWCSKPFIKSMLQRQVLRSVAKMPAGRCQ